MKSTTYGGDPRLRLGIEFDNRRGAMGWRSDLTNSGYAFQPDPDIHDPRDGDGDEAPETPLDEPRPPRVQEPPPQPGPKGPYTVQRQSW
jgi:hypothetical protein